MTSLTARACLTLLWLLLGVFAPGAIFAEPIDFADPPPGVFLDEWMVMELGEGRRIGYLHTQTSRDGEVITTRVLTSLSVARGGERVKVRMQQTAKETLHAEPLEFSQQMDTSSKKLELRGVIQDGKVMITSEQFGATVRSEHDFPPGAVMAWGALRKRIEMGYDAGTEYTFRHYEPSQVVSGALQVDVRIGDREEIELLGETVQAIRTVQSAKLPSSSAAGQSVAWLDEEGGLLKTRTTMLGLPLTCIRASRGDALQEFDPPELLMPTTVPVNRAINGRAAQRIDYVLRLRDERFAMPPLPVTGMQQVSTDGSSVLLTVRRLNPEALRSARAVEFGEGFHEYLVSNPIINCDDPAVRQMAVTAKGDASAPYEVADNLRRYVTSVIRDKNLRVGFATASEVCRNKEGDCSEHAVLLAALGRACGIPTRVAVGLVYLPVLEGREQVFACHMWTQFRLGDTWADFDAALCESNCNPTRIAFSVDSLHNTSLGQSIFLLINVLGNLEIDVQRIEPAPDE